MLRKLISWRPVWKPALVSTLAIALIVGCALFGPSPEVLAADIAQNSPEVQELLGDDLIVIKKVQLVDGVGHVVCEASAGTFALAEVDLEKKELVKVEKIKMPELSDEEKAKAREIAKADPKVQELLDKGAKIDKVFPLFGMIALSEENGETKIETSVTVAVALVLDNDKRIALVDLEKGEVERILESREAAGVMVSVEKRLEVKALPIPPMTEEEKAEIIAIAKADPGVQELLKKGAEVNAGFMFFSYEGPIASQGEDKITLGEMSKDKAKLILELKESGEVVKSWIVTVDPAAEKVVGIEPVLMAERLAPVKPSFPPPPPPEELIDMVKSDSRVQELLDKGAKVTGAVGSGDEVLVMLEVGEGDRWVVKIDLTTEEVIEVEPVHVEELGCIYRFSP